MITKFLEVRDMGFLVEPLSRPYLMYKIRAALFQRFVFLLVGFFYTFDLGLYEIFQAISFHQIV